MKRFKENTKALLFLWLLVLVSCLIVFRAFIFGDELAVFQDVGSDTLQQYLMQYDSIINALRDGNLSLWDFTNGFGTSMYALNLFHPLLFLLYLAGAVLGPVRLPSLMVFFAIGQIFLAATAVFFFVGQFRLTAKARVLGAYLYGFNGYLLVWGQHYQFGLFLILLPLLLMLAEKALKKRRFSFLLTLAVCVTVLSSVYMAYMTLLTLGLYFLFRIFSMDLPEQPTRKYCFGARLRLFLINCGSILLGLLMMMVVFLPSAVYLLTVSSRMDAGGSLFGRLAENLCLFPSTFYEAALGRIFSSNLFGLSEIHPGTGNYYEAPLLFMGIVFVIFFFQYLFTIHRQEETSRKEKAAQYLAVLLSLFCIFIQAGSMVFNGFVQAFSRHTFLFMPFAALIAACTLDQLWERHRISAAGLAASAALFALLYAVKGGDEARVSVLFLCLLGALTAAALLLGYQRRFALPPALTSALLLLLVMANMIYDSYYTYNGRETLKKTDAAYFEQLYGADVTAALGYLRENDASFYRVEKDYDAGSYCMDASAQNYFGVSTYNSTPNKNINTFVDKLWPGLRRLTPSMFSYRQTVYDGELASLMNIKYLLSHNPSLDVDGFSMEKQFGSVYLYKNSRTASIGKFYTNTISEDAVPEDTSGLDMDRFLSEHLIVEGKGTSDASLFEDYGLEILNYSIKGQTFSDTQEIALPLEKEHLYEYDRVYADLTITFDEPAVVAVTLSDSSCRYAATSPESSTVHLRMRIPRRTCSQIRVTSTSGPISGTIKKVRFYGAKAVPDTAPKAEIDISMPAKDPLVEGRAMAPADGTLMVTIPYEDGWKAYVDGEETEIFRADYGFIGLPLSAGNHSITFRYRAPGLTAGFWLSLAGWLLFYMGLGVRRILQKVSH